MRKLQAGRSHLPPTKDRRKRLLQMLSTLIRGLMTTKCQTVPLKMISGMPTLPLQSVQFCANPVEPSLFSSLVACELVLRDLLSH